MFSFYEKMGITMNKQKYHCCLCNRLADHLVERKTFVEHRCVSAEYKFYCSEHYIQHQEDETHKQLNSKEAINSERLRYLLGHIGNNASWNDFLEL